MKHLTKNHARLLLALSLGAAASITGVVPATAAEATVGLGTVGSYAVLAGSTVTNTGPTTLRGNLGVSPGTAITGFPPGTVTDGTIHANDAHAASAQAALTTAYNDAAGRSSTGAIAADLGGKTLVGGVYTGGAVLLTGTLTLDGGGDPDAVFIFQASSTLKTASASTVKLIGDARACNVFWQVGSSATLGTSSTFVGTILAQTSVTVGSGVSVEGRVLARTAAVTLDDDNIQRTTCAAPSPAVTTTTSSPAATTTLTTTSGRTATTRTPATTPTTTPTSTSTTSSTTSSTPTSSTSSTSTTSSTSSTSTTSTTSTTAPPTAVADPAGGTGADGLDDSASVTDPFASDGATAAVGDPGAESTVAGNAADVAARSAADATLVTLPRTGVPLGALTVIAAMSILVGLVLVRTEQRRLLPAIERLRRLAR